MTRISGSDDGEKSLVGYRRAPTGRTDRALLSVVATGLVRTSP